LKANKSEQAAKLEEVWISPPFSHCVFTARKDFDKDTGAKFTRLMVAMTGKDPLTATVLKLEGCKKWVPVTKEARAGFDDLLKALRDKTLMPVALRK
jgi:ABC-type phosphate/phosphonate transport system substrate-binding protein